MIVDEVGSWVRKPGYQMVDLESGALLEPCPKVYVMHHREVVHTIKNRGILVGWRYRRMGWWDRILEEGRRYSSFGRPVVCRIFRL